MAKYRLYKNINSKSNGFNKFYAKKVSQGLVSTEELIQHMAGHNTSFSEGSLKGVITDMVNCIRELAYDGKSVKIDNLGIFSVSMKSKGVDDVNKFNAGTDITSKWQVRPTGAVLRKAIGVTRAAGATISWTEESNYESPRGQVAQNGNGE